MQIKHVQACKQVNLKTCQVDHTKTLDQQQTLQVPNTSLAHARSTNLKHLLDQHQTKTGD